MDREGGSRRGQVRSANKKVWIGKELYIQKRKEVLPASLLISRFTSRTGREVQVEAKWGLLIRVEIGKEF